MSTPSSIDITIQDPLALDETLTAAVSDLIQAGQGTRRGILVTRHGPGKYSAALSDSVPFGVIHETST